MTAKRDPGKPRPDRLAALRRLPEEVVKTLSRGEVQAFLFNDVWPDTLREKLKAYQERES